MVSEGSAAQVLLKKGYPFIMVQNQPLGNKKNEGLTYVLQNYQFDYLLEIGSDDLITNDYMDLLEPYLRAGEQQLCADRLYFIDVQTSITAYYNIEKIFGLGRFIHYDALHLVTAFEPFWNPDGVRGMDTYSWHNLLKCGIGLTKVEVNQPCLLDIKSEVNINPIDPFTPCYLTVDELLQYFPERKLLKALCKKHLVIH